MLANSGDPGQTPRSVASDLGLHCLPMSHKKDAMLVWVKEILELFFRVEVWRIIHLFHPRTCLFLL